MLEAPSKIPAENKFTTEMKISTCTVKGVFDFIKEFQGLYRLRQQKWPITFKAIFDAFRLILALLHIFYLILFGLRILKWGETSL